MEISVNGTKAMKKLLRAFSNSKEGKSLVSYTQKKARYFFQFFKNRKLNPPCHQRHEKNSILHLKNPPPDFTRELFYTQLGNFIIQ